MHWLYLLFYTKVKFGLSDKRIKTNDINRNAIFQKNSRIHTFWTQKELRNFGRIKSGTRWQETKKIQIKLATTCNNNDQQQNDKSNAELQTEWMKTALKRQLDKAETGLLRPNSWRMMMKNLTAYLQKNLIFWG